MTSLRDLQCFFSNALTLPPTAEFVLSDPLLIEKANVFIKSTPTLKPHQCLEIYHKQYWFRLIHCLQNNFPFLRHYLGANVFNRTIAIPYLQEYPPTDWTLYTLGKTLPLWLEEKEELAQFAKIDLAFNESFWIGSGPPISEITETTEIRLQSHVHLFHLTQDLFSIRENLLKNLAPPPPLQRDFYFVLFRNDKNKVVYDQITLPEYTILSRLKEGSSLEALFETLILSPEEEELLPVWFYHWTSLSFFRKT